MKILINISILIIISFQVVAQRKRPEIEFAYVTKVNYKCSKSVLNSFKVSLS